MIFIDILTHEVINFNNFQSYREQPGWADLDNDKLSLTIRSCITVTMLSLTLVTQHSEGDDV